MTLVDVDTVREHVETDLSDSAIQQMIDAEDAEITRRYGAAETAVETFAIGGTPFLSLSRPATAITSVVENGTALSTSDYTLTYSWLLSRVGWRWRDAVTVTYTPVDTTAQRALVLIQLVKLAIAQSGYASQGVGDYREQPLSYSEERERLLASLAPRRVVFA